MPAGVEAAARRLPIDGSACLDGCKPARPFPLPALDTTVLVLSETLALRKVVT